MTPPAEVEWGRVSAGGPLLYSALPSALLSRRYFLHSAAQQAPEDKAGGWGSVCLSGCEGECEHFALKDKTSTSGRGRGRWRNGTEPGGVRAWPQGSVCMPRLWSSAGPAVCCSSPPAPPACHRRAHGGCSANPFWTNDVRTVLTHHRTVGACPPLVICFPLCRTDPWTPNISPRLPCGVDTTSPSPFLVQGHGRLSSGLWT